MACKIHASTAKTRQGKRTPWSWHFYNKIHFMSEGINRRTYNLTWKLSVSFAVLSFTLSSVFHLYAKHSLLRTLSDSLCAFLHPNFTMGFYFTNLKSLRSLNGQCSTEILSIHSEFRAEVFDKAISCELFWARRFLSTLNLRIWFEK